MSVYHISIPHIVLAGSPTSDPPYRRDYGFSPEKDWFTAKIPIWREALAPFVDKDSRYLEIGVYEGRSLIWVMENIRPSWAVGIDIVDRCTTRLHEFLGGWTFILGSGRDGLIMQYAEDQTFDIIYIDGDHRAQPTLRHAVLAWPLLRPNGLLIFDDYNWNPERLAIETPKMAIQFFYELHKEELDVVHRGYQVIFRKRPKDNP